MSRLASLVPMFVALSITSSLALDEIAARRALMRDVAKAERAALSVILGKYKEDKAVAAMTTIAEKLAAFKSMFPAGSETGATRADPAIWVTREAFEALADKLVDDALTAGRKAEEGQDAFTLAWQPVQAGCVNCHVTYAPGTQ